MTAVSTDRALQGCFAPITTAPTVLTGTASATAALLTADSPGEACRRFSVVNMHASQTIAVCFVPRGQAAGSETIASGRPILAGQSWEFVVHASLRVLIVADGAGTTYGGIVSDI